MNEKDLGGYKMKNKYTIVSMIAMLIAIIFGGIAFQQYNAENMDEVYLNIGYCTLFLSASMFSWHIKDEKQNES